MKIYTLKTSELCSTNGKNETALYPPFDKMKIPFINKPKTAIYVKISNKRRKKNEKRKTHTLKVYLNKNVLTNREIIWGRGRPPSIYQKQVFNSFKLLF